MTSLSDMELAKAFVPRETRTLEKVAAEIMTMDDMGAFRRRDLVSGLRRVAAAIGAPPESCPADPVWLRPRLEKVRPAALGVSEKTWRTIVSNARSALAMVGIVERDRGSPLPLSRDWRCLWEAALATRNKNLTCPLSRFVRFCSNTGIAPGDVDDAVMKDYRRALELNEIRKNPESAAWQAIHAWNRATAVVPGWPDRMLQKPIRHRHFSISLDAFPPSFRSELANLEARLSSGRLLGHARRRYPLSPRTIDHRLAQVRRFASALVRDGVAIEDLQGLDDLFREGRPERGIEWLARERHGGSTSSGLHELALGLCMLAREIDLPEDEIEHLRGIARMLVPGRDGRRTRTRGLSSRNRDRLRQFRDADRRTALLRLPSELFLEARTEGDPLKAARLVETGLAIAIVTVAPLRLRNLASLEIERHFDRTAPHRLFLTIPGSEVKNGAPLEFELPRRVADMLDEFLSSHRTRLSRTPCRWLFPRLDGTDHVHQSVLARRATALISKRLGIEMNMHLFRHLAAMLVLDADPGAYDLVRRLLGHAELSTTVDAYSGMESLGATRMLADLVETAHEAPPMRSLARRK